MRGADVRVLIVGAGIAGLAAARCVRDWGAAVEIVERTPGPATEGTGIYLPVGFQNPVAPDDQRFQAARSYSLISPPRTGRRRIGPWIGSRSSASGRGGRSCSARCGRLVL